MTTLEQAARQAYSDKKIGHVIIKDGKVSFAGYELPDGRFDLYAEPPKRKPLTDEQICQIADATPVDEISCAADTWHIRFARAIEAAHGIKG